MNKFKYITTFFFIASLTACAGGHHRAPNGAPPMNEELVTTITPGGLKIFTYTVSLHGPSGNGGGRMPPPGGGSGGSPGEGGRPGGNHMKDMIVESLLTKLDETGFCREGYIELGSSVDMRESFIRGECKEAATKEDLALYSHTGNYN